MKWIILTIAGGVLVFMAYSTYTSINAQLQSSAIGNTTTVAPKQKATVEKIQKTITDTKKQQAKQ